MRSTSTRSSRCRRTGLRLNGIGVANLWTDRPLVFEPYEDNRDLGGFILIDRVTNETVGAGLIRHALRRSQNLHAQALDVTREARAAMKGQKPRLLWFTGLSRRRQVDHRQSRREEAPR